MWDLHSVELSSSVVVDTNSEQVFLTHYRVPAT